MACDLDFKVAGKFPMIVAAELVSVLHLGTPFIVLFGEGMFHGAHRFMIAVCENAEAYSIAEGESAGTEVTVSFMCVTIEFGA